MPIANIQINAVTATSATVAINAPVQLSNADIGGETTYAWTILDQPEGATDSLSNPAIENPTFTPTREGSYRLRLVVNAGMGVLESIAYAVVGVLQLRSHQRMPAAGEVLEFSSLAGWAIAVNRWLGLLNSLYGDPGLVICTATAGMSVGSIVRIASRTDTINIGLPGEKIVMRAALATASTPTEVAGDLGIIIGVCDGSSIGVGKLVLVRRHGLVEMLETGAAGIGDFVLIDNLGEPTLSYTAGTVPRIVGRVVEKVGSDYRWVIEPGHILSRRPTSAFEFEIWSGSSWTKQGGAVTGSAPNFFATSGSAAGLHAPLKVNQGEVLYAVTLDIDQDTASTITARLTRGNYVDGVAQSDAIVSPASVVSGGIKWNPTFTGGLLLPSELPADQAFWLYISTTGAGSKIVSGATAFVRPAGA